MSVLRALAQEAVVYSLSTFIIRFAPIVLLPVYSRVLSAYDYGIIETLLIFGALLNLTVSLEISQAMGRYVSEPSLVAARQSFASTAIIFTFLSYGILFLLSCVWSENLAILLFDNQGFASIVIVAVAAISLNGTFMVVLDLLRWQVFPIPHLFSSAIYAALSMLLGVWLVVGGGYGVLGVFLAQGFASFVGVVFALYFARSILRLVFDVHRLFLMLQFSLPLVVSGFAVFANTFVGRIVIRDSLGLEALGVYGLTWRVASTVSIVTIGLQSALTPYIYRSWRDPGTAEVVSFLFRLYLVGMTPILAVLSFLSFEVMLIFSGPSFHDGSYLLPPLVFSVFVGSLYVFSPGLFLGGRTCVIASINILAAILNAGLAWLLVPYYGLAGPAFASVFSSISLFLGYVYLGQFYFFVPFNFFQSVFAFCVLTFICCLGFFRAKYDFFLDGLHYFFIFFFIALLFVFTARYVCTVADRRTISRFFEIALRRFFQRKFKG